MPQPPQRAPALFPWLTPLNLGLGLTGLSLLMMGLGTCLLYGATGPMPAPRPPPSLPDPLTQTAHRFKEGYYRSLVEDQAKRLGVKAPALKGLWRVNRFYSEFSGAQRLAVGGVLETEHLRLKAVSQKVWVGEEGHGYRTEHLLLQITNRTDRHLAYRVSTDVRGRCAGKGVFPHNALALKPRQELLRSECILNGAGPVVVRRVEVLTLSPLGYFMVSQLDPLRLGLDRRTSEGHQGPTQLAACRLLPWRIIAAALERGESTWSDVIDFYSRHTCDEYTFFAGYQRLQKEPIQLPVRPPKAG